MKTLCQKSPLSQNQTPQDTTPLSQTFPLSSRKKKKGSRDTDKEENPIPGTRKIREREATADDINERACDDEKKRRSRRNGRVNENKSSAVYFAKKKRAPARHVPKLRRRRQARCCLECTTRARNITRSIRFH